MIGGVEKRGMNVVERGMNVFICLDRIYLPIASGQPYGLRSFLSSGVRFAAEALPPLDPPKRPRAWA